MENKTNINKQALIYGLMVGIVMIILSTIQNMFFINNLVMYYGCKVLCFILVFILMGVFAASIRKSLGGFMDFKTAFRILFIMILIAELLYFIYSFIYFKFIDPDMIDKLKTATLTWMEKFNSPQEALDQTAEKFDTQIAKAKKGINFGETILTYFSMVIFDCIFGLIVAAIVKKKKPMFEGHA